MKNVKGMAASAAFGMMAMYLFDPILGHRRRGLLRDRINSRKNVLIDFLDVGIRDLQHRLKGFSGQIRYQIRGTEVDDQTLQARVAAKMGRYVSHPKLVDISVDGGIVTLRGHIFQLEASRLLRALQSIPGVKLLQSELTQHAKTENFAELQGRPEKLGGTPEIFQYNWAPATRLLGGVLGSLSIVGGLRRSRLAGIAMVGAGGVLLGRSITNRPIVQKGQSLQGKRGLALKKTVIINVPIQGVLDFFSEPQNFPHFIRNLREVRRLGEGQLQWAMRGMGHAEVVWAVEITRFEPNQLIAWKAERDSEVVMTGLIQVEELAESATRARLELFYNAPYGVAGQSAKIIMGARPKTDLEQSLFRIKAQLESAQPSRAQVTVEPRKSERLQDEEAPTLH